jgi:uncharacterized protein
MLTKFHAAGYHTGMDFACRSGCGACCIAISISSPLPGLPEGKPAGRSCIHLDEDFRCSIYARRPLVCSAFRPDPLLCGASREAALTRLGLLEAATRPA